MTYLITLEGVEGSGKSTLIQYLKELIESIGKKVIVTREPGGIEISEQIRSVISDTKTQRWTVERKLYFMLQQKTAFSRTDCSCLKRG